MTKRTSLSSTTWLRGPRMIIIHLKPAPNRLLVLEHFTSPEEFLLNPIRPSRGHNVPTEFLISIFAEFLHIFCTTKNLNLGIQDPNFSFKWLVVVYRIIFYPRLLQFLLLECQKFQCFVGGHIVPPPRLSRNSETLGLIGLRG